jgi:hypothetical protein
LKRDPREAEASKQLRLPSILNIILSSGYKESRTKDKNGYWHSELKSLGIEPRKSNELNNCEELEKLTDNVKLSMFQDYKTAYSHEGDKYKEESQATLDV